MVHGAPFLSIGYPAKTKIPEYTGEKELVAFLDLNDKEREQVEKYIASHIELTRTLVKKGGMDARLAYFAASASMENDRLHAQRVGIPAITLNEIEASARKFVRVVHDASYTARKASELRRRMSASPDFAVERNYGKFSIYWVNREKPPTHELERRIVDVVTHFAIPRCQQYKRFVQSEYESGALTSVKVQYPSKGPELVFNFYYDDVARQFGLDIWDENESNPYGSVWIPDENILS